MNAQERCDAIAKELYCGSIPDVWTVLAERLIKHHIIEAENEAYQKGLSDALKREICGATLMADISEEMRKAKAEEAIKKIKDEAFEAGATWMREEAAKVCEEPYRFIEDDGPRLAIQQKANDIRALPVTGK